MAGWASRPSCCGPSFCRGPPTGSPWLTRKALMPRRMRCAGSHRDPRGAGVGPRAASRGQVLLPSERHLQSRRPGPCRPFSASRPAERSTRPTRSKFNTVPQHRGGLRGGGLPSFPVSQQLSQARGLLWTPSASKCLVLGEEGQFAVPVLPQPARTPLLSRPWGLPPNFPGSDLVMPTPPRQGPRCTPAFGP